MTIFRRNASRAALVVAAAFSLQALAVQVAAAGPESFGESYQTSPQYNTGGGSQEPSQDQQQTQPQPNQTGGEQVSREGDQPMQPQPEPQPQPKAAPKKKAPCQCRSLDVIIDYAGDDPTGAFDSVDRWLKTDETATLTCTRGDGNCKGSYRISKITATPAAGFSYGTNGAKAVECKGPCGRATTKHFTRTIKVARAYLKKTKGTFSMDITVEIECNGTTTTSTSTWNFVKGRFDWSGSDADGNGTPDGADDRNGNRTPDGNEDVNRNGRTDGTEMGPRPRPPR